MVMCELSGSHDQGWNLPVLRRAITTAAPLGSVMLGVTASSFTLPRI